MTSKTYTIWKDKEFEIGSFKGSDTKEAKVDISWNPKDTTINNASLFTSSHSKSDWVFMYAWLNNTRYFSGDWGHRQECRTDTETHDVLNSLKNGLNVIKAKYKKQLIADMSKKRATLTLTITIDYTGKEPEVEEEWWDLIKKYLPYGVLAMAAFTALAIFIRKMS